MGKEQKKPRSMEIKFNISKDTKINIGNYILSVSGVNASGNNSTDLTTFKFIYASADKSGDNFFTWAIKQCDNQANKLKKEI